MIPQGFDYSDKRYRTVFANFGLAALKAQVIEKQLSVLLTALPRIGGSKFEVEEFRSALDGLSKPMGNLFTTLKTKMTIPTDLEEALQKSLKDRNYLIHRFFVGKGDALGKQEYTEPMNSEIISIGNHFQSTIEKLDRVLERLQKIVDVPISQIEDEARKLFNL